MLNFTETTKDFEKELMSSASIKAMVRYEKYKCWMHKIIDEEKQTEYLN